MSIVEQALNQANTQGYAPQGWQCPLCKRVWAPHIQFCQTHAGTNVVGPATAGGVVGGQANPYRGGEKDGRIY